MSIVKESNSSSNLTIISNQNLSNGSSLIVWKNGVNYGFNITDSNGNIISNNIDLTFTNNITKVLPLNEGGFLLSWVDVKSTYNGLTVKYDTNVYTKIFDNDGQIISNDILLYQSTEYPLNYDITQLSNGNIVLVSEDNYNIISKMLDLNGNIIKDTFQVNPNLDGKAYNVKVESLDNGNYVVLWYYKDVQWQSDSYGQYSLVTLASKHLAQIYNENGNQIGNITLSENANSSDTPNIISTNDGFILYKEIFVADNTTDLLLGFYDNQGNLKKDLFLLDPDNNISVTHSSVTVDKNGNLYVYWNSTYTDNYFLKIFDSNGNIISSDVSLNTSFPNYSDQDFISILDSGNILLSYDSYNGVLQQSIIEIFDINGNVLTSANNIENSNNLQITNTESVMQLYTAYFNRVVDKAGVDYWVGEMESNGWSIDDVATSFSQQVEFTSLYNGLTNTQIVEKVYQNVLNRDGDSEGKDYWENELSSGSISISQLVQAIVNAATQKDLNGNYVNEIDAILFNNKTLASEHAYNNNINATGNDSISLTSITSETSSVEELKSFIDAYSNNIIEETNNVTMDSNSTFESLISNNYVILYENVSKEFIDAVLSDSEYQNIEYIYGTNTTWDGITSLGFSPASYYDYENGGYEIDYTDGNVIIGINMPIANELHDSQLSNYGFGTYDISNNVGTYDLLIGY